MQLWVMSIILVLFSAVNGEWGEDIEYVVKVWLTEYKQVNNTSAVINTIIQFE